MNPEPGFPRIVLSALLRPQLCLMSQSLFTSPNCVLSSSHTVIALMARVKHEALWDGQASWAAFWMSLFKYGNMQLPSPGGLN